MPSVKRALYKKLNRLKQWKSMLSWENTYGKGESVQAIARIRAPYEQQEN